jgi:hypothetical protein
VPEVQVVIADILAASAGGFVAGILIGWYGCSRNERYASIERLATLVVANGQMSDTEKVARIRTLLKRRSRDLRDG